MTNFPDVYFLIPSYDILGNWRSERTCNGAETCQETLLATSSVLQRGLSLRETPARPAHPMPVTKADSVEVENVLVNVVAAAYDPHQETVRLRLITEETNTGEPASQDHGF